MFHQCCGQGLCGDGGSRSSTSVSQIVGNRHLPFLEASYQKLSPEEKECVRRDLHGLEEGIIQESDDFVNEKLDELNSELMLLGAKVKSAYMKAIDLEINNNQQCGGGKEFVTSRKFRLMFLRAERFNARLAARRLALHFKEKLKLFGVEKLASKIKEEDLSEEDRKALYAGVGVFTSCTDASGRKVGFGHKQVRIFDDTTSVNIINHMRAVFYVTCSQLEDDEISQKKGFVIIAYNLGPWGVKQASRLRKLLPLARMIYNALYCRVSAFHHCYNSPSYEFFFNILLVVQPKYVRDRIQCHYGSHVECMMELTAYGIDPAVLPYSADGEIRMDVIRQHYQALRERRRAAEDEEG